MKGSSRFLLSAVGRWRHHIWALEGGRRAHVPADPSLHSPPELVRPGWEGWEGIPPIPPPASFLQTQSSGTGRGRRRLSSGLRGQESLALDLKKKKNLLLVFSFKVQKVLPGFGATLIKPGSAPGRALWPPKSRCLESSPECPSH